jgi:hypothetical protein
MTLKDWNNCQDGEALFQYLDNKIAPAEIARNELVNAACDCANRALSYLPVMEQRPGKALDAARKYINGIGSIEDLSKAVRASLESVSILTAHGPAEAAQASADAASLAIAPNFSQAKLVVRGTAHAAAYSAGKMAGENAVKGVEGGNGEAYLKAFDIARKSAEKNELNECANIIRKHFKYIQ